MKDWKSRIISKEKGLSDFYKDNVDEPGILRCKVNDSDSYVFHKKHTKGAHHRKLTTVKYHQVQWETPYFIKILDDFLKDVNLKDKVILDFGCGDGRFTQYLLSRGATKIICVDFDYEPLLSLSEYAKENNVSDKLFLIHSDFDNLPFVNQQFDLILSIAVIYYLNEGYEKAIAKFHSLLNNQSILITSDPELEGFLFRSLLFDSLEDTIDLFEKKRFKETKEKTGFNFRVFDKDEWKSIFTKNSFEILDNKGVSMFHNIIRVLLLRGIITEKEIELNEKKIWEMLDYLHVHGNLNKNIVWKLRRIN
jgi:SAM-dependent methyltransferase